MISEMRDFSFFAGWRSLIEKLVEDVNAATGRHEFRCVELKEKFGACRVAFSPLGRVPNDIVKRVRALADAAGVASEKVCMKCGHDGRNFHWDPMWTSTLCRDHARQTILESRAFPSGEGWQVTAEFQLVDPAGMPLTMNKIAELDTRAAAEEYEKDGTLYGSKFANAWHAARILCS
jgi:hypothetical protein